MRELEDILIDINRYIELYQNMKLKLVSDQTNILRSLTTNLAQLETYRADYYDLWLDVYFQQKGSVSNAAAEKIADKEVNELHKIRKIMRGGYKVCDSIRSTISVYKQENN
ncbi:MAG: hypothetical protein GY793_01720 [Proteobacteria bacterium]|nr:hypothetical protein [Pseudomonadota bacterium]